MPRPLLSPSTWIASLEPVVRLGRGGMGEVWKVQEPQTGRMFALKQLRAGSTPHLQRAFQNEVRIIAQLDHPGIMRILAVGRQCYAMEYAALGTPRQVDGFTAARTVLVDLLEALAHIHARGVIHRDVKPSNLLRFSHPSGRMFYRLADFGVAGVRDEIDARGGTLSFMAPEQLGLVAYPEGPWTDLYAVGCVAWALLTGRSPFAGLSNEEARTARQGLPTLPTTHSLPDGFRDWLAWMLAPDPLDRPENAAAALSALLVLATVPDGLALTVQDEETRTSAWTPAVSPSLSLPPSLTFPPERDPATPTDIPRALPLLQLRTPPLIGHTALRERLAAEFETLTGPRFLLLTGPAGAGKSRLARWLVERTETRGLGRVLAAQHNPEPTPRDGIPPALARALWVSGAARAAISASLHRQLPALTPASHQLLVAALIGDDRASLTPVKQRSRVLASAVAGLAPVLLWVDDIPWAGAALPILELLLDTDARVLILATAREDTLAGQPALEATLDRLGAVRIPVIGLDVRSMRRLVGDALPDQHGLGERIVQRAGGNPLLAIELLRRVVDTSDGNLPEIGTIWQERLADAGLTGSMALLVGAVLGQTVSSPEWLAACAAVGVADPWSALDVLVERRLVVMEDGGWRFIHGMLQERILALARPEARQAAHAACACILSGDSPARLARHLRSSGAIQDAAVRYEQAINEALERHDYRTAAALLDELEAAAPGDRARMLRVITLRDAQWIKHEADLPEPLGPLSEVAVQLARAGLLRTIGQSVESAEHLEALEKQVRQLDEPRLVARWVHSLGASLTWSGRPRAGIAPLEEAAQRYRALDMHGTALYVDNTRAMAFFLLGEFTRGAAVNGATLAAARALGARLIEGHCLGYSGELALVEQRYADGLEHYAASGIIYAEVGIPTFLPTFNEGICLSRLHRPREARVRLLAAREELINSSFQRVPGMVAAWLTICAAQLEEPEEAATELARCVAFFDTIQGGDESLLEAAERVSVALTPWPDLHNQACELVSRMRTKLQ
ncbi:MAG: hypothetical protein ACI8RZ_003637 [Myxococcota bacterium]|jgi:hypothetical protein